MAKTIYNKNVANPSDITASVFSSDEQLKYGEIVLCNNINEPGIYIFAKNDGGETKIQKINSADNIILKQNVDPSLSGPVANGDTLYEIVSKLQNQIDDLSGSGESETEKINRIIAAIDLNDDGSYKIISGNYVGDATSIADAISKLDAAINTVGGSSVKEAKEYTDTKIIESIKALDAETSAGDGEVFVKITEADGLVSGEVKALSVEKDATGLKYDLKLGDYIFGSVDIPQDQFLKEVIFISAATVEDIAEALKYDQSIELGKPYLRFVWKLEEGLKPTYVDVSGLIDVYTAADVKLSDAYSGTSFDIKSGTSVEDAIGKVTNELTSIEENIESNKVNSSEKTINVTTSDTGTNIDINIDNDTIVKNENVAKQGQLSVALNVEKTYVDNGYVRTKYTLKSKDGSYGVINDTRDVFVGDETDGFIKVETQAVSDAEGNRTDKITITPVIQKTVNNATGPNVDDANGLVTAWGVKEYVRSGIDGDGIMAGDDVLQPYENYRGHINFDSSSIDYDTVHKALYKTDNNMQLLDEALGFESSGQNVHQYPSATTQDCLLIKDDRTVMDALKTLDKSIADLDFEDNCGENQVFTAFTQENGHVMLEKQNVTGRKLAEYSVVDVTNPSGATFKVAEADTLGQALGKLQGQINAMDWTGTTTSDQVFTGITEKDGLVSASTADVTTRTLKGYSVQNITDTSAAASKIATGDTLGVGLGKLQGQINAMDYTANTSSDKVFTYISNKDGQLTTSAENITNRVITGYEEGVDADVAATDTLGQALGKLQKQINSMDYTANTGSDKVFTYIAEADGKLTTSAESITSRVITGYAEGADADVAETDTLGVALGKLQGQINAMDKTASSETGKFVRTVAEADGKVSETRGYIVADDVKITAATVNEANVKEAWKLVNNEGTQLGSTIKIYKDSSLKSVALSGDTSTVGQWLVFTYALSDGSEDVVAVDVSKFLVQAEFQSGVTADNSGIVHGVVSGNSESVVTAYTATGGANGTAKVLGVNGGGFYVNNIQTAINAKVNSAISLLDSSSATTNAGYYMTGITITDGKVTAIGQAQLTAQETELTTGNSTTAIGNVVTGLSVSDHAITLNKKDFPEVAWKRVTAGGTNIDATTTADTISIVTGNTGITLAGDAANKRITISHTDTSSQASVDAGSGKFIKSVSVDTYGHVTGLTTGNTVDSATTATDSAKVAGKTVGNANGNVPLSNGTVNTNLNADMIDGKHVAVVSAIPSSPDANTIYILA